MTKIICIPHRNMGSALFFLQSLPFYCHCSIIFSSSCLPEWMLERGIQQAGSWRGPERWNLWLWQPLLLLQPDYTGECMHVNAHHCFICLTLIIYSFSTQQNDSNSVEGRCYRHRCTGPNRYQIKVSGSEWVDCPAGGTIQVTWHNDIKQQL